MGMSWQDAAEWDFVEYSKVLPVWNERHKPPEDGTVIETEPPPIEWMIADDARTQALGHKVN